MIALQSLFAVLANTEVHQVDVQHLQTVHDHANDNVTHVDTANTDGHEVNDCHHCGHCNGGHTVWLVVKGLQNLSAFHRPHYLMLNSTPFSLSSSIYRPPIA